MWESCIEVLVCGVGQEVWVCVLDEMAESHFGNEFSPLDISMLKANAPLLGLSL